MPSEVIGAGDSEVKGAQRPGKMGARSGLLIGLAAGLLSGLLGVGGGVLIVPSLVLWGHEPQHRAHGTSLMVIIPIAILAALSYQLHHASANEVPYIGLLAGGSIIGAVAGAKVMLKIPARGLRASFSLVLAVTGILLLVHLP